MKTIVYYGSDGAAALKRVSHLRALNGDDAAQAIMAEAFVGERIKADEIEFMDDVSGFHRNRISDFFERQKVRDAEAAAEEARKREGLPPQKIVSEEDFRRSMSSRPASNPNDANAGNLPDAVKPDPLDHDNDGKKGGSKPAKGKKAK